MDYIRLSDSDSPVVLASVIDRLLADGNTARILKTYLRDVILGTHSYAFKV